MSKRIWISLICLGFLAGCQSGSDASKSENGARIHAPSVGADIIRLVGAPDADANIHVVSMDESVSELKPAAVFIQPDAWNQDYRFEVKCLDDLGESQQQVAIVTVSEDANFHAIHEVRTVLCKDPQMGALIMPASENKNGVLNISPEVVDLSPEQTGYFSVKLAYQPLNPVMVMAIPVNGASNPASLIFTDKACFSSADSIVANASQLNDQFKFEVLSECTHEFEDLLTIDMTASNLIKPQDVVETDPSQPGDSDPEITPDPDEDEGYVGSLSAEELVLLNKSYLFVRDSGTSDEVTMRLLYQPDDEVTVSFAASNPSEVTVSPATLTFTPDNWQKPQSVRLTGVSDGVHDGTQFFELQMSVASADKEYNALEIPAIYVQSADDDSPDQSDTFRFRAMAANITSGSKQGYSQGHGIRIFQAVKPDVILIQEFNMYSGTRDSDADVQLLVNRAFGPEFYYHHGNGNLPNGIVSRYPITSSGAWKSNIIDNRDWDWAVIDIPGEKDLLAVSVHLSTSKNAQEMPVLITQIEKKIEHDAKMGKEYYVLLGGDFNTTSRKTVSSNMSTTFVTSAPYPVDQNGNDNTNAKRTSPYDYLLCSRDLCKKEIPVEIGSHTGVNGYTNGHVFDTRVYAKYSVTSSRDKEISYVAPAQANDSGASNMQHMAVIRDFEITY